MERTSRSEAARRRELSELWEDFSQGNFTEGRLERLFRDAMFARSSNDESDRDRITLQIAILYENWRIDGKTTWMMKEIINNQDASFSQKAKAFITWFGRAPSGGFAH